MKSFKLSDVLLACKKEPVIEIEAHSSVGDALSLLQKHDVSNLAVVGAAGHYYSSNNFRSLHNDKQYIGLVTLADIVSFLLSPSNSVEKSILAVLGSTNESLSLWILKAEDELLSSLEPLCKGVHSFLVATADLKAAPYLLSQLDVLAFLHGELIKEGFYEKNFSDISLESLSNRSDRHLIKNVVVAYLADKVQKTLKVMDEHSFRSVGVVDKSGCLVDYFSVTGMYTYV